MHQWEYRHEFVEVERLVGTGEFGGFLGLGGEKLRAVYDWAMINDRLNAHGQDGWELLHAEPHWIWSTMHYGAPLWVALTTENRRHVETATSYPEYIVGWYCTFRRSALSLTDFMECTSCAEIIRLRAKVCHYCGYEITPDDREKHEHNPAVLRERAEREAAERAEEEAARAAQPLADRMQLGALRLIDTAPLFESPNTQSTVLTWLKRDAPIRLETLVDGRDGLRFFRVVSMDGRRGYVLESKLG